jgi:predicted DNA-binding transcriptional regulator YafY
MLMETVLPLGHHAVIEGPPAIRGQAQSWLAGCVEQEDVSDIDAEIIEVTEGSESVLTEVSGPASAALRRFRLLESILPTLANLQRVSLSELASRHQIEVSELVSLLESASLCGVPPYSPDALYEILVDLDEDLIEVRLDTALSRPRRFDYAEAVQALTLARMILASTDQELPALSSAIAKLSHAFGHYLQAIDAVAVDVLSPPQLPLLRRALIQQCDVEIFYRSTNAQRASQRRVTPLRLFSEDGAWYLRGFCHRSLALRVFNVGRVEEATLVADRTLNRESAEWEQSMKQEQELGSQGFVGELQSVRVWVDERGWQILDSLPRGLAELLGVREETRLVRLHYYSEAWLESLLLRSSTHLWPHRDERWLYSRRAERVSQVLALYEPAS